MHQPETTLHPNHFNNDVPNRSTEQKRQSVYNWNRGPWRGKEGAIEKHIAEKWHIITQQEAIEYLERQFLTNRFHMTHYGGCAILFNKDTFFYVIKVTCIYLHDFRGYQQEKMKERESGWVLQCFISRASFCWLRRGGKSFITVMSLHINNKYVKKRGIKKKLPLIIRAVILEENVDVVAGDFNGASWRRSNGNNRQSTSIIEPMPLGPTPLWGPGAVPGDWADVCGFLKAPDSFERWKVRQNGAFSIHPLPWASVKRIEVAIVKCGCTWLSLTPSW